MALLEFGRGAVGQHASTPRCASVGGKQEHKLQKIALQLVGTFCVLMGIAIGVLALRFALVLMHGPLH